MEWNGGEIDRFQIQNGAVLTKSPLRLGLNLKFKQVIHVTSLIAAVYALHRRSI